MGGASPGYSRGLTRWDHTRAAPEGSCLRVSCRVVVVKGSLREDKRARGRGMAFCRMHSNGLSHKTVGCCCSAAVGCLAPWHTQEIAGAARSTRACHRCREHARTANKLPCCAHPADRSRKRTRLGLKKPSSLLPVELLLPRLST